LEERFGRKEDMLQDGAGDKGKGDPVKGEGRRDGKAE
jgi:hypothetical protein